MKAFLFTSLVVFSAHSFAGKLVANDCNPKLTNVSVKTIVDQEGSPCGVEDLDCGLHPYTETTFKDVVTVDIQCEDKVDHIDQVVYIGASFKQNLDAKLFSSQELTALGDEDYKVRMDEASKLLDLKKTIRKHKDYSDSMTFLDVEVIKK